MQKTILALSLFLLACPKLFAQKDTVVLFLDASMAIAEPNKAVFKEVAIRNDNLWPATLIKISNNSIVMKGVYSDSKLETGEGAFQYFNDSTVMLEGVYHYGKRVGVWLRRNIDSQLTDSLFFGEDGSVVAETKYDYHPNGEVLSYNYKKNYATNEEIDKYYAIPDTLTQESHFLNKDGETIMYYPSGRIKLHSVFKGGSRISINFFDDKGRPITQNQFANLPDSDSHYTPAYPGGNEDFFSFIQAGLKRMLAPGDWPTGLAYVTVYFYLDKNGRAVGLTSAQATPPRLYNALVKIFDKMPKWLMYGKNWYGPVKRRIRFD